MGREALAEAMIPVIGRLYRENNVVTSIHGRSLINKSTMNILKAHRFARRMSKEELRLEETAPLLDALTKLELGAAAIDIARLTEKYRAEGNGATLDEFLRAELAEVVGKRGGDDRTSTDVVLYGFGRIGRLLARLLIEKTGGGHGLRLRAIVVRRGSDNDLAKRASLLRRDSVHGSFEGTIKVDLENDTITANGVPDPGHLLGQPRRRSTTPPTASTTPSSSTTRDAGATPRACPSTCRARASPGSCSPLRARAS